MVGKNDVNLTFFGMRKVGNPSIKEFQKLTKSIKERLNKGREVSYLELGAMLDGQELALQTMGMGHLLGEWKLLSPDTVMPFLPQKAKTQMAGLGMITIKNK